jgi:DNA-binding transcriptional MocR family regulator
LNRAAAPGLALAGQHEAQQARPLDGVWLIRNMFRQSPLQRVPGSGVLPLEWLDGPLIANALCSISRQGVTSLLNCGAPQGFLPLRQQRQLTLADVEIDAGPEQLVTTVGVTQAIDLVAREFTRPGDTIFFDDLAWSLMFGSFASLGDVFAQPAADHAHAPERGDHAGANRVALSRARASAPLGDAPARARRRARRPPGAARDAPFWVPPAAPGGAPQPAPAPRWRAD